MNTTPKPASFAAVMYFNTTPDRLTLAQAALLAGMVRSTTEYDPVEHPEHAVVSEATLRIGAYAETTAELVPRTSRTRRVATHDIAVDNRGNAPLQVDLAAGDPDNALKLRVRPAKLVVPRPPSGSAETREYQRDLDEKLGRIRARYPFRERRRLGRPQPKEAEQLALVM